MRELSRRPLREFNRDRLTIPVAACDWSSGHWVTQHYCRHRWFVVGDLGWELPLKVARADDWCRTKETHTCTTLG